MTLRCNLTLEYTLCDKQSYWKFPHSVWHLSFHWGAAEEPAWSRRKRRGESRRGTGAKMVSSQREPDIYYQSAVGSEGWRFLITKRSSNFSLLTCRFSLLNEKSFRRPINQTAKALNHFVREQPFALECFQPRLFSEGAAIVMHPACSSIVKSRNNCMTDVTNVVK